MTAMDPTNKDEDESRQFSPSDALVENGAGTSGPSVGLPICTQYLVYILSTVRTCKDGISIVIQRIGFWGPLIGPDWALSGRGVSSSIPDDLDEVRSHSKGDSISW